MKAPYIKMKKHVYILIALAGAILCNSIEACTIPPISRGLYQNPHEKVIDAADIIILAKAVSFNLNRNDPSNEGVFYFKAIESLKGATPNEIKVRGVIEENYPMARNTFSNHKKEEFWRTKIGRITMNSTACFLVPTFTIGSTYLLISGKADDTKHYELITSKSDKWLIFVRNRLKMIHNKSPSKDAR